MEKIDPAFAAYARIGKICDALGLFFAIDQRHSLGILQHGKAVKSETEDFNYSGGSTMVHLAEYKYGRGIYRDLFKGKYGCLLS